MTDATLWPKKTRESQTRINDSTIWNDFPFRNDDIIIATYAKSGTTWMQQIVGQLVFGGDPELDVARLSPWLDMRLPPAAEKLAMVEAQTHRRFLKTHLPLDALAFSSSARYIYVGRDGRDIVWSLHNHAVNTTQEMRDQLNNLPGIDEPPSKPPPSDVRQFWQGWWDQQNSGPDTLWEHVRGWWAIRNLSNVLLVHYANLKRDLPGEIRRIAAFLEIPIDEARWDAILEHCTFDWMKANAAKVAPGRGAFWVGGGATFIHRGINGRWTEVLTPAEVTEYETIAEHELGSECARWLATGQRP